MKHCDDKQCSINTLTTGHVKKVGTIQHSKNKTAKKYSFMKFSKATLFKFLRQIVLLVTEITCRRYYCSKIKRFFKTQEKMLQQYGRMTQTSSLVICNSSSIRLYWYSLIGIFLQNQQIKVYRKKLLSNRQTNVQLCNCFIRNSYVKYTQTFEIYPRDDNKRVLSAIEYRSRQNTFISRHVPNSHKLSSF